MKRVIGFGLAVLMSLSVFGCGAKQEPIEELSTPEQRAVREQREREIMQMQQQRQQEMATQGQQQQQQ